MGKARRGPGKGGWKEGSEQNKTKRNKATATSSSMSIVQAGVRRPEAPEMVGVLGFGWSSFGLGWTGFRGKTTF